GRPDRRGGRRGRCKPDRQILAVRHDRAASQHSAVAGVFGGGRDLLRLLPGPPRGEARSNRGAAVRMIRIANQHPTFVGRAPTASPWRAGGAFRIGRVSFSCSIFDSSNSSNSTGGAMIDALAPPARPPSAKL